MGEVAEHFIEQCEYDAKHLAGSEWSQKEEEMFNKIITQFKINHCKQLSNHYGCNNKRNRAIYY